MAAPASGELQEFTQPNGQKFFGRLAGDEFWHYYRTADGHPVLFDQKTRWWHYAEPAAEGLGRVSERRAGIDNPPAAAWTPRVPQSVIEAGMTREYTASVPVSRGQRTRSGTAGAVTANVAVLLTSFPDRPAAMVFGPAEFEKQFFDITDPAVFSARELFREMSFNQHDVTSGPPLQGTLSGIQGYIMTPQTHDYYGGGGTPATIEDGGRIKELARWRAQAADAAGFDFGPCDTNNDGWVDLMCLIYQGRGQADGGSPDEIWPVRSALDGAVPAQQAYETNDNNALGVKVKVKDFIIVPELAGDMGINTIGVFAHEYGHGLGWPDLYDTQRPPNTAAGEAASEGLGRWCLMATGSFGQKPGGRGGDRPSWANPWCRKACGWLTPVTVTAPLQGYALPEARSSNTVLRLNPNGVAGPEYYLVENRARPAIPPAGDPGFDIALPGEGLLIWHIDESKNDNRNEWWSIPGTGERTASGNYKVALEQADGRFDLERNLNTGDGDDPLGPGSEFSAATTPGSATYDGTPSNITVRNVLLRGLDGSITADFLVGSDLQPPSASLTDPQRFGRYYTGVLDELRGQASDNEGISSVSVALMRQLTGGYESYNWSTDAWEPGSVGDNAQFRTNASLSGPVLSRTWTVALGGADLTPGSYQVWFQATDTSGLVSDSWFSWFDVVLDANAPDVTFTEPSPLENYVPGVVPDFAGTAVNTTAPITVHSALKMETGAFAGRFYDWTTNAWSATGVFTTNNLHGGSTTPWSVSMAARPLQEGRFLLFARVTNGDGRISDWRAQSFRVGQPVQAAVTRPGHGSVVNRLQEIGGTITDPTGTGVQGGAVSFRLTNPSGESWNGSQWAGAPVFLQAPVNGSTWSFSGVPSPQMLAGGTYAISASVTANTGESSAAIAGVNQTTFSVDVAPPSATIVSPANEGVITTSPLPAFHGTMSDPGGIGYVNCYIRRNRDGAFWTGNTWTADPTGAPPRENIQAAPPVAVLNASFSQAAGTWTCTSPLPRPRLDMENGSYNFIVIAADRAGNFVQVDAAVTLDYHQVFVWTGLTLRDASPFNNSRDWETWSNWSPPGVPGPEDYALIANGDQVDTYFSRTVRGIRMVSGMIYFPAGPGPGGTLTTTHDSTWTGGWLSGQWNIPAGGSVIVSGADHKYFWDGTVVNNQGLFEWQGGGTLVSRSNEGAPVTFNNQAGAVFRIAGEGNLFIWQNGNVRAVFNNLHGGRIEKTTPGIAYWYTWNFNNYSDIFINSGEIYPYVNTVNFYGASALMGSGIFRLNTAFHLHTNLFATAAMEFIGGFVSCEGGVERTLSGPGVFNWSAGSLYGKLTRPAGTSTTFTGADHKEMADGCEIINEGTLTWTGDGSIRGRSVDSPGAVIRNRGTFLADTPSDLIIGSANVPSIFYNEAGATFTKANPGTTYSTWQFHNAGTVNINQGWLEWHRNGTHTGEFNIAENCWLHVFAGTHSMADGTPFNGAGNVLLNGATVDAAGVLMNNLAGGVELRNGWLSVNPQLRGSGLWKWTGGGMSGTISLGAGCHLDVSGAANIKEFWDDTTFDNHGTFTWQGGAQIRSRNNAGAPLVFNNHNIFRLAADGTPLTKLYGNSETVFNNLPGARIEKTAGSGVAYWYYWTLENESEIAIPSGELYFYVNRVNLREGSVVTGTGTLWLNTSAWLYAARLHSTAATNWIGNFLACEGGTRTWAGPGLFTWTNGTLYGGLKLEAGVSSVLSGPDLKVMADESQIINEGTLTWTGIGGIRATCNAGNGPVIRNRGTFTADTPGDLTRTYGNVPANFYNEAGATFTKLNPATTFSLWEFHNAGTININEGWLEWHQPGTHTGVFNIADNCWLHVYAGTHNMAGGTPFNGAGNVLINGATVNAAGMLMNNLTGGVEHRSGWLSVNPQLRGTGPWKWTGGGMSGTISLGAGNTLDVSGAANIKEFQDDTTFDNFGTFTWLGGGQIRSRNNAGAPLVFNNHGTFRLAADGTPLTKLYGNSDTVFNNLPGARIEKTAGDGIAYWYYWTLNNESEIALPTGGLYLYLNRTNLREGSAITGNGTLWLNTSAYLYAARLHSTAATNWTGNFLAADGGTRTWEGPGLFTWTGGTLYGSLRRDAGTATVLSGPDFKIMADNSEIINEGDFTYSGTGNLRALCNTGVAPAIRNRPGGVFRANTTASFQRHLANLTALFENSGAVEIGAGEFYMNGWNFIQLASGALYSDITATGHDQLYVTTGNVTAAGTLHLRRSPEFTPPQGTNYNILTGTTRTGNFANVTGGFTASYQPTLVSVTVQPPAETYAQWIAAAGFTGPDAEPSADPDKDGMDNYAEFAFHQNPALPGDSTITGSRMEMDGDTWLVLHYRRWSDREQAGVHYAPQAAAELTAWSVAHMIDEPDPVAGPLAGSTAWRARIKLSEAKRFLRVRVSGPGL